MLTFITSSVFADWLGGLSGNIAKANILNRLALVLEKHDLEKDTP